MERLKSRRGLNAEVESAWEIILSDAISAYLAELDNGKGRMTKEARYWDKYISQLQMLRQIWRDHVGQ